MKRCFSNATVLWNERDIALRDSLILEIPLLLKDVWCGLNKAVRMERVETPILTPERFLTTHLEEDFPLLSVGDRGYLRPETTVGTYEAMRLKFPMQDNLIKNLPFCMWQVGISFREEAKPQTMRASKLRLVQFYQMEFQLFTREGTKAPYLEKALEALLKKYRGEVEVPQDLPHYSGRTQDWHLNGLEVAGLSERSDWPYGMVFEVAIGLDRLVALMQDDT